MEAVFWEDDIRRRERRFMNRQVEAEGHRLDERCRTEDVAAIEIQ